MTSYILHFQIGGMTCSSCVHTIETNLSKYDGVLSVNVALATERGRITYDPDVTGPRDLIKAVEDMGFEAGLPDNTGKGTEMLEHRSMIKK